MIWKRSPEAQGLLFGDSSLAYRWCAARHTVVADARRTRGGGRDHVHLRCHGKPDDRDEPPRLRERQRVHRRHHDEVVRRRGSAHRSRLAARPFDYYASPWPTRKDCRRQRRSGSNHHGRQFKCFSRRRRRRAATMEQRRLERRDDRNAGLDGRDTPVLSRVGPPPRAHATENAGRNMRFIAALIAIAVVVAPASAAIRGPGSDDGRYRPEVHGKPTGTIVGTLIDYGQGMASGAVSIRTSRGNVKLYTAATPFTIDGQRIACPSPPRPPSYREILQARFDWPSGVKVGVTRVSARYWVGSRYGRRTLITPGLSVLQ